MVQSKSASIRVHYSRRDGLYEGWGIHLWGEAVRQKTDWKDPVPFDGEDDFGRFVAVRVDDPSKPLRFLIHCGDRKDVSFDRLLPDARMVSEVWLKQGHSEVWTERPPIGPEIVRAELLSSELLRARIEGPGADKPGCPLAEQLSLGSHDGTVVGFAGRWCEGPWVYLRTLTRLDLSKNWFLSLGPSRAAAVLSGGLLDELFFYEGDDLGVTVRGDGSAIFKLWSPPAVAVVLHLYSPREQSREIGSIPLARGDQGVWSAEVSAERLPEVDSLEGCYYQYEVTAYGRTARALDPYTRSMATFVPGGEDPIGKGAVVSPRRADPPGFRRDDFSNLGRRPGHGFSRLHTEADFIGYELHVRDFTIDPASGVPAELRGTYRGFVAEKPLRYLTGLGITHVQLMPVQSYYTVDEARRCVDEGNNGKPNYNWGYDPHNYFAPEGWLSASPVDPYFRIRELKELVQALHRARIGVILDVVFNHVYDQRTFENVAPGCYLRHDEDGEISTRTGAGPTLESRRRMVRKLIVDSVRYFAEEFHVDGFRFDLMEFLDQQTLREVRGAVGEDLLLYGEAWDFSDLPAHEATTKHNMPAEARLAAFSDSTRDAFAGRMQASGFAQGEPWALPRVRAGIIGNIQGYSAPGVSDDPYDRFARNPTETLNYLSIHDGFTLWDKLNLSSGGSPEDRARLARLAMAMLFTAQGRIVLHGGDEIGRTKPLAPANDPSADRAHTSGVVREDEDLPGVRQFHENSYASADYTNRVRWARLEREPFRSLSRYLRDLIRMRQSLPALRLASADQVRRQLRFIAGSDAPDPAGGAGYRSFGELPELTLELVNGPADADAWLAGEVLPAGGHPDKNPKNNPFPLRFDEHGAARIRFSREQIDQFDLRGWGDANNLNLKVVLEPGTWNTPPGAYTYTGNNTVRPAAIRKENAVTIDLRIQDHVAGSPPPHEAPFVAFELDASQGEPSPYDRLVVVYNSGKRSVGVSVPDIDEPARWRVLLDAERFSFEGIGASEVWIERGSLMVPRKSVAVIGRLREP